MDDVEDRFEGTPDEIKEAPPPTPEASEKYVGSLLQLPHGQSLAQGRVLKRAHDSDDNVIGHAMLQHPTLCQALTTRQLKSQSNIVV